jgi:dTDP-4-amino-4,6-dideoxygalactose transaminase
MSYNEKIIQKNQKFPNADLIKNQILCIPIYPKINDKQIQKVVSILN